MSTGSARGQSSSYQVTVAGALPARTAALLDCSSMRRAAPATTLRIRPASGGGPADITRMLTEHGLTVLCVRRVSPREAEGEPGSTT